MLDFIARLFRKADEEKAAGYVWRNTGFGLAFSLPQGRKRPAFRDSLPAYQYTLLQQMAEAGAAKSREREFHIESDVLCQLDENSRDILTLPPPWPGKMELDVQGTTRSGMSVSLKLLPPLGMEPVSYELTGPFIATSDGEQYLPDEAQWQALHAVQSFSAIAPEMRTETDNLRIVYELQKAREKGLAIDLRRFSTLSVTMPDHVGVSAIENPDGSIRLVPDFGDGVPTGEVEVRLGQLENGESGSIRVGSTILLLDERRLNAVHEILSSRLISRTEKYRFFTTPTAYLDAALVDLDMGFSLRMHGMEVFRKAYFGATEPSELSWFGETEQNPDLVFLSACAQLVKTQEDLDALKSGVREAQAQGKDGMTFKDMTVLLPPSGEETQAALERIEKKFWESQEAADKPEKSKEEEKARPVQISVSIDLHDEEQPEQVESPERSVTYPGELYREELKYIFKPYQEEGTRWILGLMAPLLQDKGNGEAQSGGLLADDMGLGKTFMVLAALNVYCHVAQSRDNLKPVLAVMPVVLLENWKAEIEKVFETSPFRDIVVLQAGSDLPKYRRENMGRETEARDEDDMPSLSAMRYSLKVGSHFGSERLDMPGRLVLTNYDTLRDYQFSLSLVDWGCVVFDEAQEIKNPNALKSRAAKALKADFRLAVTGTPVENSLIDFWSLFDTVLPGLLGSFQDFNRTYEIPIRKAATQEDRDAIRGSVGRQLRTRVGQYMLRRTKEEKLEGLPRKIVHDGEVERQYCAMMSGRQLDVYNSIVAKVAVAKASGDVDEIRAILLPSLRKLQSVSLHPALLDGEPWAVNTESVRNVLRESAKLSLLLDILNEIRDRDEKVILFVINKALQRFLAFALGKLYGLKISTVNGETRAVATGSGRGSKSRMELIRDFESREGFQIICMSPLAAGVGITVTGANNVVHLERHWNPAREAQATDRVYRIGATRDVHVYLPLLLHPTLKSFDANLNELLRRKVDLKDAVVTVEDVQSTDFDSRAMFDTDMVTGNVDPGWLDSISWTYFEALVAAIAARKFGGTVYLTQRTGDHGADVIVLGDNGGVAIECKRSRRPFGRSDAACAPYTACREYSERYGKPFDTAILAVNAPSVESNVIERAKTLNVTIWDKSYLADCLAHMEIPFAELETRMQEARLEI